MEKTHFFVAVPLPDNIKETISLWKESLPNDSFKRWVHPNDYHITLAFLGFATPTQLSDVIEGIEKIVKKHNRFPLSLTDSGTFGREEQPRIFWLGLEKSSALNQLQKDIADACRSVGFEIEKRAYKPHITIARQWNQKKPFHFPSFQAKVELLTWVSHEIVIYQTHLKNTPKYEAIKRFPLGE
ncbi:RNA 2',3'-cyclic phosphodiesterase [Bacillus alkalicellulosilyticus]|uniref:RNA 2',3'-cyclic phosphodiesterase n=1 Tax=Alkalihalobacterium alkalicellulosilyticum TaxID=1912214 RepID=UPI0014839A3B|nr:RNA 2',3'-cyclic phosphodiesterase [Bacillus alkalicellulosilyticus]